MKLSRSSIISLALALMIFGTAGYGLAGASTSAETDNAYVRGDVTPVSIKVPGLITNVGVGDNQLVRKGDILFQIDNRDYRARVEQARAQLAARRAELASLDWTLEREKASIAQARATLLAADAEDARAARELDRIDALRKEGWVTRARADEAIAARAKATAGVSGSTAAIGVSQGEFGLIESRRPMLRADIAAAEAELRLAEIDLEATVVRAPADGRVADRQVREGQYVRPGSNLIWLVASNVWVVANFKETELRELRADEPVTVTIDALSGVRFRGRVDSLAPATGAQFALIPPDTSTGNFTRIAQRLPVKVLLVPGQDQLKRLRPGMSARVTRHRE